MLKRLIEWSVQNKFLVLLMALFSGVVGALAMSRTPLEAIPDLKIGDFVDDQEFSPDMDYPAALRLAIKREEFAYKLYNHIVAGTEDPELNKLFSVLTQEESKHKLRLETEYDENGELDEAIEVSKKIITLAFSNNLKTIVNEEKKFLELIENKVTQKFETIEILESKDDLTPTTHEVEKIESVEKNKFEEDKLNFEREKAKYEKEKQKFEEVREAFKQERLKLDEEKKVFKWEKQMFEEMKKHERSKEKNIEIKED